jgi:hypothetical protein
MDNNPYVDVMSRDAKHKHYINRWLLRIVEYCFDEQVLRIKAAVVCCSADSFVRNLEQRAAIITSWLTLRPLRLNPNLYVYSKTVPRKVE